MEKNKNITLKKRISSNQLTLGSWITLGNTSIAEILANSGLDWIVVDLEHTTISLDQAGELIRTIDLSGVTPLVRLTSNDSDQIKRIMDAGAEGIIVPMVNNADEAIKAVQSTRYPPIGTRGVGLARAQQYGVEFKNYVSWVEDFDSGPIVIVQIEHIEAVDNLESILEVEGVDAFIVGPYDLSCSMGIPGDFDDIRFKNVMKKIIDVSDGMGKVSGLHIVEPDIQALTRAIDSGYKFIAYSVDIRMLDVSVRGAVSKIKEINKL